MHERIGNTDIKPSYSHPPVLLLLPLLLLMMMINAANPTAKKGRLHPRTHLVEEVVVKSSFVVVEVVLVHLHDQVEHHQAHDHGRQHLLLCGTAV